jgi:hypothetical protein
LGLRRNDVGHIHLGVEPRRSGMGVRLWRVHAESGRGVRVHGASPHRVGRDDREHRDGLQREWQFGKGRVGDAGAVRRGGSLGNPEAFDELVRLTAPRVEYRDDWWPSFDWLTTAGSAETMAGAPPGAGVNVLGRQRIGPFDVTRLAANDPAVLANWLSDNGFPSPDGLEQNLARYVADRWELVAIKLAPAEATGTLTGQLQPLTLSFTSDRVIYPMRLSRSAKLPQTVDLYVLADHRMDPSAVPVAHDKPALEFAGRLDPTTAALPLQPYLAKGEFLTRWSNSLAQPDLIDGDYMFSQADIDTPYQDVVYVTRDRGAITGLILVVALGLGTVMPAIVVASRRRRSRTHLLSA